MPSSPPKSQLIKRIGGINPNTVVVLIGGGMIMTAGWEDVVPAIVYGWYSGMEGGNALPRVLFGDVNPSGKLPFTIPQDQSHLPYFSNTDAEITYDLYHGYSYLEKHGYTPAYPFGFGLSYTTWAYGEPQLDQQADSVTVTVDLKNTGDVAGAEVVQVYVGIRAIGGRASEETAQGVQEGLSRTRRINRPSQSRSIWMNSAISATSSEVGL